MYRTKVTRENVKDLMGKLVRIEEPDSRHNANSRQNVGIVTYIDNCDIRLDNDCGFCLRFQELYVTSLDHMATEPELPLEVWLATRLWSA